MERKLIFDAALKLIREGKFHSTPMSEIAYHARLTESTTVYFFESRDKLLAELMNYISDALLSVIEPGSREGSSFEERFYAIWMSLYEFYVRRPEILTFVEQAQNLGAPGRHSFSKPAFMQSLVAFFARKENTVAGLRPETLANLFHGSVATAAKINLGTNADELRYVAQILWDGLGAVNGTKVRLAT